MFTCCVSVVLLSFFAAGSTSPIRGQPQETATKEWRHRTQETRTTTSLPDEDTVVDSRLARTQESHIGYYGCKDDSECVNGGNCVTIGEAGNICNCTKGNLGPFCAYESVQVRNAVKIQPQFQVAFRECLKTSGKWSNVNTMDVFDKCGSAQNLCWFREGGVTALKNFFWCMSNSMRLSITEEKPIGESRVQSLSFYEKVERSRQLPPGQPQPAPQGVPVASIQINIGLYNIPRPQQSTMPVRNTGPTITIQPSWTYWTTQSSEDSKTPSQQPTVVDQTSDVSVTSTQNPDPTTAQNPTIATTPNNNSTSTVSNDSTPTNETNSSEYNEDEDYPSLYSLVGNSDLTFLGNVVEDTSEDYDEVMFDMVPYVNTSSNMRG